MHPDPASPASPLRGWSAQGPVRRASRGAPVRRWLRRVTAGTTTAAMVLLAAPAVVTPGPGAGADASPGTGATGRAAPGGAAARSAATDTRPPTEDLRLDDLRLVGHRKPHPYRTIKRYRVRPGDTLSGFAVRFHAWTAQLMRINHTRTLYAGDVILVPVVTRAVRAHNQEIGKHPHGPKAKAKKSTKPKKSSAKAAKKSKKKAGKNGSAKPGKKKAAKPNRNKRPGAKSRAPHRVRHARGWHHRGASLAEIRRAIVRKAKRHGVNPALALAVSWQESGWQHDRVSPAGAIGAMQVMPGTGRWMATMVGRRLNIKDLHDNITAGVVLLRWLRDEAGPRVAVAGYYQGLAGVRRHGMYPSTKRYVANVHYLRKRIEKGWSPV